MGGLGIRMYPDLTTSAHSGPGRARPSLSRCLSAASRGHPAPVFSSLPPSPAPRPGLCWDRLVGCPSGPSSFRGKANSSCDLPHPTPCLFCFVSLTPLPPRPTPAPPPAHPGTEAQSHLGAGHLGAGHRVPPGRLAPSRFVSLPFLLRVRLPGCVFCLSVWCIVRLPAAT